MRPPGPPGSDEGLPAPVPVDGLLVVDLVSGALLFADAAAVELFALGEDAAAVAPRRLLPELVDLTPREFVTRLRRGEREFDVAVTIEPLRPGPFNTADAVLVRVRGTDRLPAATQDERAGRRERLWNLVVRGGFAGAEQVRALLRAGVAGLGLEAAILGKVEGAELHVVHVAGGAGASPGDILPLAQTTARDAVRRAGSFAVADTSGEGLFRDLAFPARSFLSAAFRVGPAQWCASFTSAQPRALPFDDDDWAYVELLCLALSRAIERSESDAQLEFQAFTDDLTGLPNRTAIQRRLEESVAEAQRLEVVAAVLFVDIDGFKAVNDTANHDVGDAVLREVAERLRSSLRREEFIGRWGGDEFVIVLLPVKSAAQIEAVAARIANVLDEPFTYAERSFALGASIGVALYPDDEVDPDRLRNAADAAMYRAKEDGGARIRFHDGRRAGGPHTTRSTPDAPPGRPDAPPAHTPAFASAPSSDAGYLVTYEPIYYLREAEICAAEAVVRRVDPERGLLPANGSMPLESDPLALRALDEWVVREALAEGRTLASGGFELALDVRLATRDASIFDRLNSNGFTTADWRRIRVAVDARDAAEPGSAAEHFLELCARHGLGFVLDGFEGSLAELHTMASVPVFTLRVNTAFIEGTAAQPGGLALLQGTLSGARALGWRMIANGVETQEQRDFVVTLGVDGVQGPYVGHAMTANDFAGWLKNRRESPPSP